MIINAPAYFFPELLFLKSPLYSEMLPCLTHEKSFKGSMENFSTTQYATYVPYLNGCAVY